MKSIKALVEEKRSLFGTLLVMKGRVKDLELNEKKKREIVHLNNLIKKRASKLQA